MISMIIPIEELSRHDYTLSSILAFMRTPTYASFTSSDRPKSSMIYVTSGKCRYDFSNGGFTLCAGSVAYLPTHSRHTLTVTEEGFAFVQIDFSLKINGEEAFFSDRPLKLTDCLDPDGVEAIFDLRDVLWGANYRLCRASKLLLILSAVTERTDNGIPKKLLPAIGILHNRLTAKLTCSSLAESCFLGESQFYKLFVGHFGCTPHEYRDALLLKQANKLLKAGEIPVCEVADILGFDSAAYFCRFYKKNTGITPTDFKKSGK